MKKISLKFILTVFIISVIPGIVSAKTIAFVGTKNLSGNAEYDFLGAFTEGVILFDLSNVKEITLVERSRLEKIISEQQLQLAGLTREGQEKQSIEVGRLLAADYLLTLDYTLVGGEAAFTLRLADTTTGTVRVFTSRGSTENDIHTLSEGLAKALTGKDYSFINKAERRSLLTLRDTMPGSISLYCNLLKAEIMLDDKFAGYTTGNLYTPIQIPDIDPGTYRMRIHLSKDFGVVKLPEFTFSDWEQEVTVRPGRVTVLRSVIRHFNDIIYEQSRLLNKDYSLTDESPKINDAKSISFIDREGKTIAMEVSVAGIRENNASKAACTLLYNGKEHQINVSKENPEIKKDIEKIRIELKLDTGSSKKDKVYIRVIRTDIHQGMHRE